MSSPPTTILRSDDRVDDPPEPPVELTGARRDLWDRLWSDPVATLWSPSDTFALLRLVMLQTNPDAYSDKNLLTELRELEDRFLLSASARASAGVRIVSRTADADAERAHYNGGSSASYVVDPFTALGNEMARCEWNIGLYERKVNQSIGDDYDLLDVRPDGTPGAAAPWRRMCEKERDRLHRLSHDIARLGLTERQVQVMESQVAILTTAFDRAIQRSDIDGSVEYRLRSLMAEELDALEQSPSNTRVLEIPQSAMP